MSSKQNIYIKKAIYVIIVILLVSPLIQKNTVMFYVKPLKGSVKKVENPKFTLRGWFSGEYQSQKEEFINHTFGFRTAFVRLQNQIDYWLFQKLNAKNVVVGKEGYLFEQSYISEYLGRNFIGKGKINQKVAKLKSVSDSLSVRGIDLIVLLAAGKASYFPEFFPDKQSAESKTISNYDYLSKTIDSAGILNIDFNSWFVSMKDTSRYPLYTKGGIHWSKYGEFLVVDSLIRYVEKLRGIKLPYFKLEDIEISTVSKYRDNDIGEGLNLIFPHSTLPMAYPSLSIDRSGVEIPVKAMIVADSYYWELYSMGLSRDIFDNGQFWYYNKKIYSQEPDWVTLPIIETDIRYEIEKNDVVFILQTEATLYRFAFGFIDKAYELYSQKDYEYDTISTEKQEINSIIRKIKASKKWYSNVKQKAKEKGISIEEMLQIEVRYIIEQRNKSEDISE